MSDLYPKAICFRVAENEFDFQYYVATFVGSNRCKSSNRSSPHPGSSPGQALFPPPRRGGGVKRGFERLEHFERFQRNAEDSAKKKRRVLSRRSFWTDEITRCNYLWTKIFSPFSVSHFGNVCNTSAVF